MRILIFGGRGWLGGILADYFQEKKYEVFHYDDVIQTYQDCVNAIVKTEPTHVIIALGRTHAPDSYKRMKDGFSKNIPMILPVQKDELKGIHGTIDDLENPDLLFRNLFDNILAPLWIAQACKEHEKHCSYFGTGCIYHYNGIPIPMTENVAPNFAGSSYSAVKSITDQYFHQACHDNVLNIRIRLPITKTAHPRNLLCKILGYRKLYDIPNACTYIPAFLPILEDYMMKRKTGSVHFVHPKPALLSELYQIMIDELKLPITMPETEIPSLSMPAENACALRSQNAIVPQRLMEEEYVLDDILDILRKELRTLSIKERNDFCEYHPDLRNG